MNRRPRPVSLWDLLRDWPPIEVRLAARLPKGGKNVYALSGTDVAILANIPLARINEISRLFTWKPVTVDEAERFCAACGFDPTNGVDRHRQKSHVRQRNKKKHPETPPDYLRRALNWETELKELWERAAHPARTWQDAGFESEADFRAEYERKRKHDNFESVDEFLHREISEGPAREIMAFRAHVSANTSVERNSRAKKAFPKNDHKIPVRTLADWFEFMGASHASDEIA